MESRWWQLLRVMLTSQREVGAQRLLRGHDARCGVQSGAWKYNDQVSVFWACVLGERNGHGKSSGSTTCEKSFPREFGFLTSPAHSQLTKHLQCMNMWTRVKTKVELGVKKSTLFQSLFSFACWFNDQRLMQPRQLLRQRWGNRARYGYSAEIGH